MGNSPSKSNNAPSGLNSSSSNSTTTVASANATEATEPPDRKFPITHTSNSIVIKNNKQSYNKSKLQPKITSKSPVKFTYFHEDDSLEDGFESHPPYGCSNSNSSNSRSSPFDLEIDLQMAKTLNINNSNKCHHSTSPIAVTSTNTSANNNPNVDEMSSSFSDLFTNPSSPSSSLSITPPFNNLPPIIEEQHTKQRPKLPTVQNSSSSSSAKKSSKRQQMSNFDIDSVIEKLLKCGDSTNSPSLQQDFVIKPHEIATICSKAREEFLNQPTLLRLNAPIKVVGDIHGQFNDLLRILKLSGFPPDSSYLFLGDYVDRGKQSLETILLMLCFKIKYPNNFFMLRGNHECANITKIYGFYDECKRRVNLKCWKNFIDVFNTLPIAAVINDKIFCIHGGLSPFLQNLSQIESILRPTDIPEIGLLADLLWSDPDPTVNDWMENDRGVSYCFGKKVVEHFCKKFKFDLVIRGHMVVEDGYEFFAKKKLVTVFSAPNYCGEFNNWGAVMSVDRSLMCSFELLKPTKK